MFAQWLVGGVCFIFGFLNTALAVLNFVKYRQTGNFENILLTILQLFFAIWFVNLLLDITKGDDVEKTYYITEKSLRETKPITGYTQTVDGEFLVYVIEENMRIILKRIEKDFATAIKMTDPDKPPRIAIYDGVFTERKKFWFSKKTTETRHDYYEIFV